MIRSALAAAVLAFATLYVSPARACSCAPPPDAQTAAEGSALVVDATLKSGPELVDGVHRYTFTVARTFKGDAGDLLVVETRTSGAACGRVYADGGRYLIYAHAFEGGIAKDNLCSRTRPWDSAADDVVALGGTVEPDKRTPPEPKPEAVPDADSAPHAVEPEADSMEPVLAEPEAAEPEAAEPQVAEPEAAEPEDAEPEDDMKTKDCSQAGGASPTGLLLLPALALARRRRRVGQESARR